MAADRWSEVNRLFHEAAALAGDDRPVFLREQCGDDTQLLREVESLLLHRDQPVDFLEQPAFADRMIVEPESLLESADYDPLIGRIIGPFRIDRRVAIGGMGTVYHARRCDEYLTQDVAIKILHRPSDPDELRRRFKVERETQAHLNHPNIARLQDAGVTPDGLPYLIMEFVNGLPIVEYCDRRKLELNARLRLFQVVCSAVHCAHQHLVVHRDLKPGNILVTADGVPKLLDFGVAKVLDRADGAASVHTETMQQMLSVDYASPEQIRGDPITTETDIYSLGVILYELLVGGRPYRLTSQRYDEIERAICLADPSRPSTAVRTLSRTLAAGDTAPSGSDLAEIVSRRSTTAERLERALRGDLDNIVMMAMRKEPSRRYASSQQLSEDIQRFLGGHPVLARRDTLTYRVRKFARRNRTVVSAVTTVVIALVIATIITARQARIAGEERDAARRSEIRAAEEAAHARIEAESSNQVAEFLADAFLISGPMRTAEQLQVARQLLDRHTDRVRLQYAGKPHLRANLLDAIGRVHLQLHMYDEAESLMSEGAGIRAEAFGEESLESALSLSSLGELDYVRGRFSEAEVKLRKALSLHESLDSGVHTDVALACNNLATALRALRKFDEAETLHLRALDLRRRSDGSGPLVAESLNNLAGVDMARGRFLLAQSRLSEALEIRRHTLGESHPLVAQTLANLATAHMQAGDFDAAEAPLREAIRLFRLIPNTTESELARAQRHLAEILRSRGRLDEAQSLLEDTLTILTRLHGPDHLHLTFTHESLATLSEVRGDHTAAERHWREALRIRESLLPVGHASRLAAAAGLGRLLMNSDRAEEGLPLLLEAAEGYGVELASDHPRRLAVNISTATCLLMLNRFDEAESMLREAWEVARGRDGPYVELAAAALTQLIHACELTGRSELADSLRRSTGER